MDMRFDELFEIAFTDTDQAVGLSETKDGEPPFVDPGVDEFTADAEDRGDFGDGKELEVRQRVLVGRWRGVFL